MNEYKINKIEYVDIDRWRKSIRDSRLHYEAEKKQLGERINSMSVQLENIERELERIRVEEELMTQTIRAYEERIERPPKRSNLQGNNLRETLIIHFASPSGILIGKETSKALVELKYFSNRTAADGAVYTTLGKPPFQKLDKGIYFIPIDSTDWKLLRGENGNNVDARSIVKSGLKKRPKLSNRIKDILKNNANMSIKQISRELLRLGWDFQGKNPKLAVSGALVKIRNAKK
jgi:hypothetical protein